MKKKLLNTSPGDAPNTKCFVLQYSEPQQGRRLPVVTKAIADEDFPDINWPAACLFWDWCLFSLVLCTFFYFVFFWNSFLTLLTGSLFVLRLVFFFLWCCVRFSILFFFEIAFWHRWPAACLFWDCFFFFFVLCTFFYFVFLWNSFLTSLTGSLFVLRLVFFFFFGVVYVFLFFFLK